MKLPPAFLSLLLLAACAASPGSQDVTVQSDEFSKDITLIGVADYHHPLSLSGDDVAVMWRLRSFINKETHAVTSDIYMEADYDSNLKYYNAATDENAHSLTLKALARNLQDCERPGCPQVEKLYMPVPEAYLEKYRATGYRVKVTSQNGDSVILTLSPVMIRKQLEALAKYEQ